MSGAIDVMKSGYARFQNVPKHIVVDGDEAVVTSHISAANAAGVPIEAEVANYFRLEDPAQVVVHDVEARVTHEGERTSLRGIVDRIEVRDDGEWVLVDYKTGRPPSSERALGSFFGLKFYALVCWRAFGRMPRELRLIQLGEPEVITLHPTEQMLLGLERQPVTPLRPEDAPDARLAEQTADIEGPYSGPYEAGGGVYPGGGPPGAPWGPPLKRSCAAAGGCGTGAPCGPPLRSLKRSSCAA